MSNRPLVGVAVIVRRENHILLGKRKNSHGKGTWAFPGGHLEYGENIKQCAVREVLEETGLQISNLQTGPYSNDIFTTEQKHYITLFVIADYRSGGLEVKEPHKCERWDWFDWNHLPDNVFLPIDNLRQQHFDPFSCEFSTSD